MTVGGQSMEDRDPCSDSKPTATPYGFTDRDWLFFVSESVLRESEALAVRDQERTGLHWSLPVIPQSQTDESVKDTR